MDSRRLHLGLLVLLFPLTAHAGLVPANSSLAEDDILALARLIDQRIEAGYVQRQVTPAPLADDAEFLRRVYLDLTGRIPPVSAVHAFLASKDADKRRRLVDRLLASPNHIHHFANAWRAALLQHNGPQANGFAPQIEAWLRRRLRDHTPYDRLVRELLTGNPAVNPDPAAVFDAGPAAFLQANEQKAENLAASTSRLFLGIKLECAQCHDHPFARWNKTQFWEYAAFFAGLQNPQAPARQITIPGTNPARVVQARFLDGKEPQWQPRADSRQVLVAWLTAPDNPFFARVAVNRFWDHFFGVGLVDPVDDFGEENPPSHPELLDDLAAALVRKNFDARFLIQAITASRTYQRTSTATDASQEDVRALGRMALKGLSAEQLFDSLCQATGFREGRGSGNVRADFLNRFANPSDRRTEHQTSILQALALMNGKLIADVTSVERSQTLGAIHDSPFLDTKQKLQALFYAALSRPMRSEEESRYLRYVSTGGPSGDSRKALADVFWVLLNSSEFSLNH